MRSYRDQAIIVPDAAEQVLSASQTSAREFDSLMIHPNATNGLFQEARKGQSEFPQQLVLKDLEEDFNSIFEGSIGIADFIRQHEKLAQDGNANSMHFLAEAMKDCIASMTMIEPAIDKVALLRGEVATNREDFRERVRQEGHRNSEFAIQEWASRVDRAYDCFTLEKDVAALGREYQTWESLVAEKDQPHAVVAAIISDLANKSPDELEQAKSVIRDVLVTNKNLETILAAEKWSSFVTGRGGTMERAAWALLACEYYDCESTLSYRYRTTCEIDAQYGDIYCTPGMTDAEFLRAKVPGSYDIARGRAMELKQILDQRQWAQIGL
jgi:hypothetical protein